MTDQRPEVSPQDHFRPLVHCIVVTRFSVPLAKKADTSGIILVTSTTHQGRADGDFVDAGGNLLATVSYPDGNPSVNVAQFARDAMSPFVNVG